MWNRLEFTTPHDKTVPLEKGINQVTYQKLGSTWIDKGEAHCQGESTIIKGVTTDDIIEDHAARITLSKEIFKYRSRR